MKQSGDIAQNKTGAPAGRRQPMGDGLAEIKHPLSAIMTNADAARRWLRRTDPNFQEALAALDRIVRESARIDQTIDDCVAEGDAEGPMSARLSSTTAARGA
jgi:His Kinase A (phospho-acceptor) domain